MSASELGERTALTGVERSLTGWGRTARAACWVRAPSEADEVEQALALADPDSGVIARGAGRSYGDAAQNAGGLVLELTGMDRILTIDRERGLVRAQAGATVAELMASLAAEGLTLPVLPGTRHVTLAGAIASDIHGKNHHLDGALARHVQSILLCTPAGGVVSITPEGDPALFYATLGGMGLTGVILEASVRVQELPSPWVAADIDRSDGLVHTLELLGRPEHRRYSVAWLDMLAPGAKMGRAVITRADKLARAEAPHSALRRLRGEEDPGRLRRGARMDVPAAFPADLLRPSTVRAFNAANWRASPRHERGRPLALAPYFFPLDVLGGWNHLYGPDGLVQYQFVIPAGQEAALERSFELMRARRLPIYLAVFKRFGEEFGGPLSFPLAGWTLAIDLPGDAPGLGSALQELDELIAGCGGRVYLTKDSRMSAEALEAMYPRLGEFREIRARVDPRGVLRSDLAVRLGLCEAHT